MTVLPDTRTITDEIVARVALSPLQRALPYEPSGSWPVPCLLVPPPAIEKLTPAIYRYSFELLWVERSAQARAAHVNLNEKLIVLRDALMGDQTLGGTASGCWVRAIRPDDEIRDLQSNYWFGARLDFEVHTSS
jgi:hypothetical protein